MLAPLALLSRSIIAAIIDGTAPAGLTGLAKALPYSRIEQDEKMKIGLSLFSTGDECH